MNEYNLIIEARNKNEQAINLLLSKYYNNIKAIVFKYKTYIKNSRLEYSDVLQEALLAFFKSIESYEVNEKVKFNTYFNSVIDRKIRDYIRKNNSKKEKVFNQALSLEDEEKSIYKFLSNNEKNPLNLLINYEEDIDLKNMLSIEEYKVYELKKEGKSNKEVSLILDKSIKSIYNSICRIKGKLVCLNKSN